MIELQVGFFRLFLFASILLLFSCTPKNGDSGKESQSADTSKIFSPIELLSKKIKEEPKNATLYFKRSQYFLTDKNFSAALNDINTSLSLDSTKSASYLVLADICFATLNIVKAEEAFGKAISLDNQNIEAYLKFAELELYLKKYPESIFNANEALRIDKHRAKGYFIKGYVYQETHDTAKAFSSFQTCIEQEPGYYDAYIQLGILAAFQKSPLAVQYYTSALKLRPNSTEAYYNRGFFFQQTGDIDNAINDYNQTLKINPGYKEAYFNLGYIELREHDNYQKAIEYFSSAIDNDKYYAEAFYNRGYCFEKLGKKQRAIENYKAAIEIVPTFKLAINGMKRLGH